MPDQKFSDFTLKSKPDLDDRVVGYTNEGGPDNTQSDFDNFAYFSTFRYMTEMRFRNHFGTSYSITQYASYAATPPLINWDSDNNRIRLTRVPDSIVKCWLLKNTQDDTDVASIKVGNDGPDHFFVEAYDYSGVKITDPFTITVGFFNYFWP